MTLFQFSLAEDSRVNQVQTVGLRYPQYCAICLTCCVRSSGRCHLYLITDNILSKTQSPPISAIVCGHYFRLCSVIHCGTCNLSHLKLLLLFFAHWYFIIIIITIIILPPVVKIPGVKSKDKTDLWSGYTSGSSWQPKSSRSYY